MRLVVSGHGCPGKGLHPLGLGAGLVDWQDWGGDTWREGGSHWARKLSVWHLREPAAVSSAAVWAFRNREVSESWGFKGKKVESREGQATPIEV